MIGAADWKRTEDEIKIRKVDVADVLGRDQDHVREIEKGAGSAAAENEGKNQIVLMGSYTLGVTSIKCPS